MTTGLSPASRSRTKRGGVLVTRMPSPPVRPRRAPARLARAPGSGAFVRRSLTQTSVRVVVTIAYAATFETWITAWRGTPSTVSVATYQPAGSFGTRTQRVQSISGSKRCTRASVRTASGRLPVGTGAEPVNSAQSGTDEMRSHARMAAAMSGSSWTVSAATRRETGPPSPMLSTRRRSTAPSLVEVSASGRSNVTRTVDARPPVVSNAKVTSRSSVIEVPWSGRP